MRKQTFSEIGKKMTILLVVFFVASLTATTVDARGHGRGSGGGCGGCGLAPCYGPMPVYDPMPYYDWSDCDGGNGSCNGDDCSQTGVDAKHTNGGKHTNGNT